MSELSLQCSGRLCSLQPTWAGSSLSSIREMEEVCLILLGCCDGDAAVSPFCVRESARKMLQTEVYWEGGCWRARLLNSYLHCGIALLYLHSFKTGLRLDFSQGLTVAWQFLPWCCAVPSLYWWDPHGVPLCTQISRKFLPVGNVFFFSRPLCQEGRRRVHPSIIVGYLLVAWVLVSPMAGKSLYN